MPSTASMVVSTVSRILPYLTLFFPEILCHEVIIECYCLVFGGFFCDISSTVSVHTTSMLDLEKTKKVKTVFFLFQEGSALSWIQN